MRKLAIVLVLLAACTKKEDQCTSNADCTDPAYPFCDVDGQYPESGGSKNVCTIVPPECPVSQCGCEAGATTCGSDNMLTVCDPDGMSATQTACGLGCEVSGTACKTFTPSNGLEPALASAATQPALVIASGSTIDTDSGGITDVDGNVLTAESTLVAQTGTPIRVFAAQSFVLGSITVTGAHALALVASGDVAINGEARRDGDESVGGPGANVGSDACTGSGATNDGNVDTGAGGAGGATTGAPGGGHDVMGHAGGAPVTGFDTLVGGCAGGSVTFTDGVTPVQPGGAGGGAIQIVSASSVHLSGVISVGGGGGGPAAGGGGGGLVVIETPVLTMDATGGIAANGGGGGGGCNGTDATPDLVPAPGGTFGSSCLPKYLSAGGSGATEVSAPTGGGIDMQPTASSAFAAVVAALLAGSDRDRRRNVHIDAVLDFERRDHGCHAHGAVRLT